MGDFKHLVLMKFKEGAAVGELLEGMKKLASEIDAVKSFEWGEDVAKVEMLSHGFTHVFIITAKSPEDLSIFLNHPNHVEFGKVLGEAIDKVLVLDFPAVAVKPSA